LRIEFSHFHPGSGKDKSNPENPVNPVEKNKNRLKSINQIGQRTKK
jgi:hypothetical protein